MILPHEAISSSDASPSSGSRSASVVEPPPSSPSQSRSRRVCTTGNGELWANPFTLLSVSTLFCVIMFILSVIDRNVLSVLYPISSALTVIHHVTITVLYLKRGGRLYFVGREAPGIFIGIPNLVALVCLVVIWGASSIFGAILASSNNGRSSFGSLPIFTPESALYARLIVCAVFGFFEAAIMVVFVMQFVLQRRRGVEQFRKRNEKNGEIPMSPA